MVRQAIEGEQAAAGAFVFAGAEGRTGIDLEVDGGAAGRRQMRAVYMVSSGAERRETGLGGRHPVGLGDRFDGYMGRLDTGRRGGQSDAGAKPRRLDIAGKQRRHMNQAVDRVLVDGQGQDVVFQGGFEGGHVGLRNIQAQPPKAGSLRLV